MIKKASLQRPRALIAAKLLSAWGMLTFSFCAYAQGDATSILSPGRSTVTHLKAIFSVLNDSKLTEDFFRSEYVGSGYDTYLGAPTNIKCVELRDRDKPLEPNTGGPEIHFRTENVISQEQLYLSLGRSVSGSYGGLGGSGSASTNYGSEQKYSNYRNHAIISTKVNYPKQQYFIDEFQINSVGKEMLEKEGGIALFRLICGDSFVIGYRRGGIFQAVVNIDTTSSGDQTTMDTAMAIESTNGNASIETSEVEEHMTLVSDISIDIVQNGLEETLPELDIPALAKYARECPICLSQADPYANQ